MWADVGCVSESVEQNLLLRIVDLPRGAMAARSHPLKGFGSAASASDLGG